MKYDAIADSETVQKTITALAERGVEAEFVATGAEALEKIKTLIPQGASVMNGSSRTLEEIGFVEYLKTGAHGWNNLHAGVLAEQDPARKAALRKQAVLSDWYLGSVHAIVQTGEMLVASASGSQLPHLAYTSPNLILVAGTQKIVPAFGDLFSRLKEYVFPLEDARMKEVGMGGSVMAKIFLFQNEPKFMGRNVRLLLVDEVLGF